MTSRRAILLTTAAAIAAIGTTLGLEGAPQFIWNVSESVPTGLYRVQPARHLTVSVLVAAHPPELLAAYLSEAGYLPRGVPLIKRILALPGQTVCRTGLTITVDGIEMGVARKTDRRGRPLLTWQGCRVIAAAEVFLMNPQEPASLDGRYFGPIPLSSIIGRAEPLWTFDKD
jgi:conjugative transfer signal peptidase TraF